MVSGTGTPRPFDSGHHSSMLFGSFAVLIILFALTLTEGTSQLPLPFGSRIEPQSHEPTKSREDQENEELMPIVRRHG